MSTRQLQPDWMTFNSVVQVCQRAEARQVAFSVLALMRQHEVQPGHATYNIAMTDILSQPRSENRSLLETEDVVTRGLTKCSKPLKESVLAVHLKIQSWNCWTEFAWAKFASLVGIQDERAFLWHSPSQRPNLASGAQVGYILRLEGAKALLDAQVEELPSGFMSISKKILGCMWLQESLYITKRSKSE